MDATNEAPETSPKKSGKSRRKRLFLLITLLLVVCIFTVAGIVWWEYGKEARLALGMEQPTDPFGGSLHVTFYNVMYPGLAAPSATMLFLGAVSKAAIPILATLLLTIVAVVVMMRVARAETLWDEDGVRWELFGLSSPYADDNPDGEQERRNARIEWTLKVFGAACLGLLAALLVVRVYQQLTGTGAYQAPPPAPYVIPMNPSTVRPADTSPSIQSLYELTRVLGSGSAGQVCLAKPKYKLAKADKQPYYVAIKIINPLTAEEQLKQIVEQQKKEKNAEQIAEQFYQKPQDRVVVPAIQIEKWRLQLRLEAQILKLLSHPNIVRFYDYLPREGHAMYSGEEALVTEYVPNSLERLNLNDPKISDPEGTFLAIAKQLFSALSYLHDEQSLKHMDIKPANILYHTDPHLTIKLIDFGLCRNKYVQVKDLGTRLFMAPEVYVPGSFNEKADIWSAALTLIALYCDELVEVWVPSQVPPKVLQSKADLLKADPDLAQATPSQLLEGARVYLAIESIFAVREGVEETMPRLERVPHKFRRFLMRCFVPDPKRRPSARELLADEIFQ